MALSVVNGRNLFAEVSSSGSVNRQNVPGDTFSAALAKAVGNVSANTKSSKDPVKEFLDYMSMTPGERMLYAWLKQKGISKEEFDAYPPEKKQKLMDEMRREIEMKVKQQAEASARARQPVKDPAGKVVLTDILA